MAQGWVPQGGVNPSGKRISRVCCRENRTIGRRLCREEDGPNLQLELGDRASVGIEAGIASNDEVGFKGEARLGTRRLTGRQRWWEAVSYTHLDVYKRQP